ncbi:MAG: type II secretion system F family protein [Synergistaceae bacterium]|jgi:type IV pilus assembly protein PilC|nr:type II secretion system F family protein [Synergistaceae bacterium]
MLFRYRARTTTGTITTGSREAASQEAAVSWLREQGMSPISVEAQGGFAVATAEKGGKKSFNLNIELIPQKVTLKDKNIIFKQMATMVNAGITVAATLDLLANQTENKTLKTAIVGMRDAVGGGVTFGAAMSRYPKIFTGLEISLVKAGEEGGVLDVSMARLADFVEKQYALQKKVKSAMTYPSVVVAFTMLALGILSAVIVPMFRKAFDNMGMSELPKMTAAIFGFSDFLRGYWFTLPIPFILLWVAMHFIKKSEGGRRFLDKRKVKAPLIGDIIFKAILARSFRTFATLVTAGVSILDSIEMSAGVADNVVVKDAFRMMRERAQNGILLSATIKEQKLFPAMVAHMVAVGEETGQVDEVLSKVADWYDMELDEKIKSLTSIIEPVLIVFIGLVVGLVVGSIFVPLIQSMQQLM